MKCNEKTLTSYLKLKLGSVENLVPARELVDSGPWTVHWLDTDESAVREARRTLHEAGVYGRITVEPWEESSLPYADNLVNLIISNGSEIAVEEDELLRVLAPQGSAFINDGNDKTYLKKQRPGEMGEWTHPWHDADGSLSASDRAFDIPNAFQWVAGPPFPLADRKTSTGALLSAGGRTFQITQNVVENFSRGGPNYLIARDAFNGTFLWSREWKGPLSEGERQGVHNAVVTCGEKVYGARDEGVSVFDASTGDVVSEWSVEGTPDKLLLAGGILVAQSPKGLTAFDAEEGKLIWSREMDGPRGALVADGQVYFLTSSREKDGQWQHKLAAVELESGGLVWEQPTDRGGHPHGRGLRLHFAGAGVVCLIEWDELQFLCAEDGTKLWRHETDATSRSNHDSRMAGHFLIDEKVWIRGPSNSKLYKAFDPRSGEMLRETIRDSIRGLGSCQPMLATSEWVLKLDSAADMWNLDTGRRVRQHFFRGGCRMGATIANGMIYTPPHACGCGDRWYYGNLASVRSEDPGIDTTQPGPLQRGAAYGEVNAPENIEDPGAWPMYRRDGQRSGYLPQNISTEIKEEWRKVVDPDAVEDGGKWRLRFGRRLSPPVAADGMVMLTVPQKHQVIALAKESGEENWRFTAGGRVSSPPTIHGELVLFGAHDGFVYALRRDDGELVWRRRAAPSDRRIMAYGQVESAWPVKNVFVHDGLAMAVAGRAADEGGGPVVHGFQPESGEVNWSSRIKPGETRHGMPDLLVTDGEEVYMMNRRIDTETGETSDVAFGTKTRTREWSEWRQPLVTYPGGVRYLRSGQAGFFETSWTRRSIGLRKHLSSWNWGETGGELIAFSPDVGYAFLYAEGQPVWHEAGGGRIEALARDEDESQWLHKIPAPAQVEAMFVAENALFVAGPNDRANPIDNGGFLRIINREDGAGLAEIDLPATPVHDGMAAAGGRVFVTLTDGSVICLRGEDE